MKMLGFLNDLLGRTPRPRPAARPARPQSQARPAPSAPGVGLAPEDVLLVDKAANQFAFIDRAWHLRLWRDAAHFADWKHDVTVKRQFGDLIALSLEAIGADGRVLFRHKIKFAQAGKPAGFDCAGGVELPLLDRAAIKSARLLVFGAGREAACRHLLRLPWSDTQELALQPGDAIVSDHAARITGGRQAAELHVAATARHRLEITQCGHRDFAFARDLDRPLKGIFLHKKFAPPGFEFRLGRRVVAHLITGPKGIQARTIRPL